MARILLNTFLSLFIFLYGAVIVVHHSVVHIRLLHGAVLHVMPGYRSDGRNGAVIICPGGGYSYLEKWHEGYKWFPYLYLLGYTPAMLEYRMPHSDSRIPMTDGAEAVRMMRRHAEEWRLDTHNVGMMGFSAGGHLASTMMVTDDDSARPDFGILLYPLISMKKELTHIDSHDQLLGKNASVQLERQFSNELHVSEHTPPVFIAATSDDEAVNPLNSILFHNAMRIKNRPVELHIYSSGGHGWVVHLTSEYCIPALMDLADWLNNRDNQ